LSCLQINVTAGNNSHRNWHIQNFLS